MGAEILGLCFARAFFVEIIEPGFADPDDLGMVGECDQSRSRRLLVGGLVRMDADRAENIVVGFGDRAHGVEVAQLRADGQHRFDARRFGARHDARKILLQVGIVEMAMAVDEHGA